MLENEHYHRWFGILPSEMPTHAYRILGIELFELDEEAICDAIDRRQSQLRSYLQSADAEPAAEMMGAIEQIGECLLDPDLRATYDTNLRGYLQARQSFVVRFDEPNEPSSASGLETLPGDELVAAASLSASRIDGLSMVPIPTQRTGADVQRRRRKDKNVFIEIAKVIGGGVAGLLLGYLVLSYLHPDNDVFRSMGIVPINRLRIEAAPADVENEPAGGNNAGGNNQESIDRRRMRE